jgi:hypothetical protein
MAGGLLNIVSVGSANVILTGNPTKTFFKVTYSKYTNFGLQKFRIDYDGVRDLRPTTDSTFTFKIKRYAELLMDTYLVVTLPNIWSPLFHPCEANNNEWSPYDFRWIKDIGTHMIRTVEINCGSQTIQRYSGEYLAAMVNRDFTADKKDLFNRMSGNVDDLTDPANAYNRSNVYPAAYYSGNPTGEEPSIRGRTLYIPINTWFTLDSRCAFPLVSLQYNELSITVTLRPIQELYQIRDAFDTINNYPYIQPDYTADQYQLYRFLQTPPAVRINASAYENKTNTWNADIHLISTYCFLSKEEAQLFAAEDQVYLVKDVFEYSFPNVTGSSKVKLTSNGMISNWMFYFQRDDVNLRNEWSNYTNWPYRTLPADILAAPIDLPYNFNSATDPNRLISDYLLTRGPLVNPTTNMNTGYYITGAYSVDNRKDILETLGIVLDGDYRENVMTRGIYDYIEKYTRTNGAATDGLYCYNFCLNTNPLDYQPSGAINLSRFKSVELEFTTYAPQFDLEGSNVNIVCDDTGIPIGISSKPSWRLYQYNFNMTLFEERYNILSFIGGNCGMLYAR